MRRVTIEYSDLTGLDLSGRNLSEYTFHVCKLDDANFYESCLSPYERTVFRNCTGRRVSFKGAGLKGAEFDHCYFEDSSFRGADMEFVSMRTPTFVECDFESTWLQGIKGGLDASKPRDNITSGSSFLVCSFGEVSPTAIAALVNSSYSFEKSSFSDLDLTTVTFEQARLRHKVAQ